ncbi:MAG: transposase [Sulfuricellaceae bacterium]|nr:transposase [Sulfuricellaceae bacterium]
MTYADLRKGRFSEPGREYLVTAVTHGRRSVFDDFHVARLLVHEMQRVESEGKASWLAWVIMPDHVHGLLSLNGESDLAATLNDFKGRSARAINRMLGRTGAFWQPGFHDHALRKEEDRLVVARYIVANPLRAGLVERLGDYSHWDSVWL